MKLEKRSNPPQGLAFHPSPIAGERCGICNKTAIKRMTNAWRVIDTCSDQNCLKRSTYWVTNKPYTNRVEVPQRVFKAPPPFKYLTRRADPVAKPPASVKARHA